MLGLTPDHARLKGPGSGRGRDPHRPDAGADPERPGAVVRLRRPWATREDPVTGSLNASLAQWLIAEGLAPHTGTWWRKANAWARLARCTSARMPRAGLGGRPTVTCIEGTALLMHRLSHRPPSQPPHRPQRVRPTGPLAPPTTMIAMAPLHRAGQPLACAHFFREFTPCTTARSSKLMYSPPPPAVATPGRGAGRHWPLHRRDAAVHPLDQTCLRPPCAAPTPEGRAAGADYRVRIFTPLANCPLPATHAGHLPAWLKAGGQPQVAGRIVQECGVGLVSIRQQGDLLAFAAPPLRRSGPLDEGPTWP